MKVKSYFVVRTVSKTQTCVFFILVVVCCTERTKSWIFDLLWYQVYRKLFSEKQGCDELRQLVNVLLSILLHVTVTYIFHRSFCTFSKCSLSLTHCRVNLYYFSIAKFFLLSNNVCSLVDPSFLGSILFCNHTQKFTNRFLGTFCFHSSCIYSFIKKVLAN